MRNQLISTLFVVVPLFPVCMPMHAKAEIQTVLPSLAGRVSLDYSDQQATAYQLLKTTWSTAKPVTEKSVLGWYEGRCYFRDRPNQPIAALLAVSAQDSNVHGDLQGLSLRRSVVQLMDRDAAPDRFAKLTPYQRQKIQKLISEEKRLNSFAYESMGADFGLTVDFFETEKREPFRLTLRRSGDRLFTSTTCSVTNGCYDQSRPGRMMFVANLGETAQYCYYFRRLMR